MLTLVVLIFSEIAPKALAPIRPEKPAFGSSRIILLLMQAFYPVARVVDGISNRLPKTLGFEPWHRPSDAAGEEKLRAMAAEDGSMIPARYQHMLFSMLTLESPR